MFHTEIFEIEIHYNNSAPQEMVKTTAASVPFSSSASTLVKEPLEISCASKMSQLPFKF